MSEKTIYRSEMMPLLIEASPGFKTKWYDFLAEYNDELNESYYIVLGDYADYLVMKWKKGNTEDFPAVFAAIEKLLIEGDEYVKDAAAVGLLEDIQNIVDHISDDPQEFKKFLLPESVKWWDKINKFWDNVLDADMKKTA